MATNLISKDEGLASIRTPPRGFSPLSVLFSGPTLPGLAARLGLRIAAVIGKPLRLGKTVVAVSHADVSAVLARDLDFVIAPVNQQRIESVNGPFILGMDRCPRLAVERGALYGALAAVDMKALEASLVARADRRLADLDSSFDALIDYARPLAAETASELFGIAPVHMALFAEVARAIFAHTFLNLSNDPKIADRATRAAPMMRAWFEDEIERRAPSSNLPDLMGRLLEQGLLDKVAIRRTLGGMLVGSIDTTVSVVAKVLVMMLKDPELCEATLRRRREGADIYGLCLEALRRWPHNSILLRQAAAETQLGGRRVRAGDRVVAWTQAAMLDPAAFPNPKRIDPARDQSTYQHFGAGLHPCAGRVVNSWQIPILVGKLLDLGITQSGKLGWAGPFPDSLPVRKREKRS